MLSSSSLSSVAVDPAGDSSFSRDPWLAFNRQLNRLAVTLPTEADLCLALDTALEMEADNPSVYWLTLSRIAELAINLAGDYADSGEVCAAGDILVNPRRIDVYLRGKTEPIQKDRHCGLSEQFAWAIGDEDPVAWLMRETQVRIKRKALLPHLQDLLSASGYVDSSYLDGIERRLSLIADTIGFMCALESVGNFGHVGPSIESDQALIEDRRCRFTARRFVEMGEEIERMILSGNHRSRFLRPAFLKRLS